MFPLYNRFTIVDVKDDDDDAVVVVVDCFVCSLSLEGTFNDNKVFK